MKRGSWLVSGAALTLVLGMAAGARGQPPPADTPPAGGTSPASHGGAGGGEGQAVTPAEQSSGETTADASGGAAEPAADPSVAPDAGATDQGTSDEGTAGDEALPAVPAAPVAVPSPPLFDTRVYGFIDAEWRDQLNSLGHKWPDPALRPPAHQPGFDVTPTLMVQGTVASRFRYFIILAAPFSGSPANDLSVDLRNAWVEASLYGDYLNIRVGKTYRQFGLYNEILDATPTFIGTEPPAYLNEGQLLLTRTTNLMIHGQVTFGDNGISYALMTGNDEVGGTGLPLGVDLRYTLADMLTVGASFYWSGKDAKPTSAVGQAPTHGGVINYMDKDEYVVAGGYAELHLGGLTWQLAYFHAHHNAKRNPMKVVAIATMTPVGMLLNPAQRQRLFNGQMTPMPSDVNVDASYDVQTAYTRIGYEFDLGDLGVITPYIHLGWFKNGEAIPGPIVGGNEAGLSDDAQFFRVTPGVMYRPIPAVALKAEFNSRHQTIGGSLQHFYEIRTSLSYLWEL